MRQRVRKLWGLLAIIALLIVYPLAVMEIYVTWMMALPWWGAIAVLAVAGLLWFYPASWVVRWMSKPDEASQPGPSGPSSCWWSPIRWRLWRSTPRT